MNVSVQNFQSIALAELVLDGLTVLVGPSDRGKSALVRAIEAALFNTAGDYFVRTGASSARVILTWPGHIVQWEKGGGKNQFRIDGELHAKVGMKAPDALRTLGFRDELIGARLKEDGTFDGGKWVRPQFAGQFEGIYLLDEPGTFINEVLVKLSRLGVLQRAERQCALDLRSAGQLLRTRQRDLDLATTAAEALAGAPHLRARLDVLLALDGDLDVKTTQIAQLRRLSAARRACALRLATMLPPVASRSSEVPALLTQYQSLLTARQQLARRALLVTLPKKLAKSVCAPDGPEYKTLALTVKRYQRIAQLVGARQMRQTAIHGAANLVQAAFTKQEMAQEALATFRASLPLCPVCERPFEELPRAVAV